MAIELLSEQVIDQIKAGEVVDSPSGLLKELIENSLDAKATHLYIEIENLGLKKISITDNGHGMDEQDLQKAFLRHSTSKIQNYQDLNQLSSFGFRGEALASISAVSRLKCISKQKDRAAHLVEIHGSELVHPITLSQQFPSEHGTTMIITDLFYKTPARYEFLQNDRSELNNLKKILTSYCLIYPQLHIEVLWDKEKRDLFGPCQDTQQRIEKLTQKKSFIMQKADYEQMNACLIINPQAHQQKKIQQIIIDQRPIDNKKIHYLLQQVLAPLWQQGTSDYCLKIHMPPHLYDINVHPKKTEIKFQEATHVYALISGLAKLLLQNHSDIVKSQQNFAPDLKDSPSQHLHSLSLYSDNINQHGLFAKKGNFLIYTYQEKIFLLNLTRYFQSLLQKTQEVIPLLISDPIELKSNFANYQKRLMEFGFEIDAINAQHGLLRSIPKTLAQFDYLLILKELINRDCKVEKIDFNTLIAKLSISDLIHSTELSDESMINLSMEINIDHLQKLEREN